MERNKPVGVQNALHSELDKVNHPNTCEKVKRDIELWKAFELDWQVDLHKDNGKHLDMAA